MRWKEEFARKSELIFFSDIVLSVLYALEGVEGLPSMCLDVRSGLWYVADICL